MATAGEYTAQLVTNGKEQLKKFNNNNEQRPDKLIGILEGMVTGKAQKTQIVDGRLHSGYDTAVPTSFIHLDLNTNQ